MRNANILPTPKFLAFRSELKALCLKHKVVLGSSLYDSPAVFDMNPGDDPIYLDDLSDFTDINTHSKENAEVKP